MPNLPISGLTASASNAAATDVLPVVQTTGTGPVKMTVQQMAGGLLGSTTLSGATITADAPVLNMAQTWNNAAVTFTGLKFNVTDTASNASSLLMDLQVGGSSKFKVDKNGTILTVQGSTGNPVMSLNSANANRVDLYSRAQGRWTFYGVSATADVFELACVSSSTTAYFNSTAQIGWTSGAASAAGDTILTRRAAANLRLGAADAAAPVAQTLSVQSGTAGASALSCSISGTTLTVGGAVTGTIAIGHAVTGTGVSAGTVITAGSGTTWTVNNSQTVSSTTMYFNSVGQNLTITGSQGSGPSAGGSIVFQVAPAGSAGTTAQNALADALTLNSARQIVSAIAGSAATPAYNFLSAGSGLYLSSNSVYLATSGSVVRFGFGTNGAELQSTGVVGWSSSSTDASSAKDLLLFRDAANTLALRNGTNPQTFRVYNTYDGTNDERGFIKWASNVLQIGTDKTGTGTARALEFQTNGVTRLTIAASGPVTVSHTAGLTISNTGGNGINTTGGGYIIFKSSGVLTLTDVSDADFGRLQFGGTTSSFPALKRSSTTLQARLADDSAFAGFASANMQAATAYTVATLPGTPGTGMIARVTDALAPTIGATVTGGGAAYALVNYNGANWTVIGI